MNLDSLLNSRSDTGNRIVYVFGEILRLVVVFVVVVIVSSNVKLLLMR